MRAITMFAIAAALLATGPGLAQTPDWQSAQTINIDLSNFKFTPSTLSLEHGKPYRLHLTNSASGGHDFVAKALFAASNVAPEDQSKLRNGGIELDGGESVDIRLVPSTAGTYKFNCTHFMHSMFGMTGSLTVR